MCELHKTFKGPYCSCLHVKERKKNNIVNRFHRIGPEIQAQNSKKVGSGPLKVCPSTHVWRYFKIMCESCKTFEGPYFLCLHVKELKKNNIVNRFHQIESEKQAQK